MRKHALFGMMGRKRNDEKIQVVNIRMVKEPSIYSESRISRMEDTSSCQDIEDSERASLQTSECSDVK